MNPYLISYPTIYPPISECVFEALSVQTKAHTRNKICLHVRIVQKRERNYWLTILAYEITGLLADYTYIITIRIDYFE